MRLWSIHPRYLDTRGLVALWREALLAQAVLNGKTRGYVHHPQLQRFRVAPLPLEAIAFYLRVVQAEAKIRHYHFDAEKITAAGQTALLTVTDGQCDYEWAHLKMKLSMRAPAWLEQLKAVIHPEPHPLFQMIPGPIETWEKV